MDIKNMIDSLYRMWDIIKAWLATSSAAMDVQTAVICAVVFIISAIVVYLISVFGMRERTYEEAIEEQRRRNLEAVQLAKHDKTRKDKKFKKWNKKNKDKNDDEKGSFSSDGQDRIPDNSENKQETESGVVSMSAVGLQLEPKSSNFKKKGKRGKVSKDNVPHFSSSEETDEQLSRSNSFNDRNDDSAYKIVQLRDICIDAKSIERDDNPSSGEKPSKLFSFVGERSSENSELECSKSNVFSKSPTKKSKKSKFDQFENELTMSTVLQHLKTTPLSEEEVNLMLNILTTKQSNNGEWTKKNDPVLALKKQILEKEEALNVEQKLLQSANEKMKSLHQELGQEKSRALTLDKSLREKINQQQQEIQNLHGRIQLSHDQHAAEMQAKIQKLKTKLNEENAIAIQRLKEEYNQLQTVNRLESEKQQRNSLEASRLQLEVEQLRSARDQYDTHQAAMQQTQDELRVQVQQLEKHIEQLVSSHQDEDFSYKQRINEMSNKLQQADKAHSSLVQELQNAQAVCSSLEADKNSIRQRFDEVKHQYNNSEQDRIKLESQLEAICKSQIGLASCVEQMRNEILELNKVQNDHLHQIQDFEQENEKLKNQLADYSGKQMSSASNEFCQDNVMENQTKALDTEEMYIDKVGKNTMDEKEVIVGLMSELESYRHQLEAVVKELNEVKKIKQETVCKLNLVQKQGKLTLKQIFPDIEIPEHLDDIIWYQKFEENAVIRIHELQEKNLSSSLTDEMKHLKEQLDFTRDDKVKLQLQVEHYKQVLSDTESVLNKLQEVAEGLEKSWQEKMTFLEEKLNEVAEERNRLSVQNNVLEKNFKQLEGIHEMQAELVALESRLQAEEYDKQALAMKFKQAMDTINDLEMKLTDSKRTITCNKHEVDNHTMQTSPFLSENDFTSTYEDNSNTVQQKPEKRKKPRKRNIILDQRNYREETTETLHSHIKSPSGTMYIKGTSGKK